MIVRLLHFCINESKKSIFSSSRPVQTIAAIQPKNMVTFNSLRMVVFSLSKNYAN